MSETTLQEFVIYFKNKPKVKGTCYIYERNDRYSIYGDDSLLINQEILKTFKVKVIKSGDEILSYVNISKNHIILVLKHLIFVHQFKIEILRNVGSAKNPDWKVCYKASPGNLTEIEDILVTDSEPFVQGSRGVIALKTSSDSRNMIIGLAFCNPVQREFNICQFADDDNFTNLQAVLVQLSPNECLLPVSAQNPKQHDLLNKTLHKIMETHQIAVTEGKKSDFKPEDIVQDLSSLLHSDELDQFNHSIKDNAEFNLALSSLSGLVRYLQLLSDNNNFEQFSLSVFYSNRFARVDLLSLVGLGLFPENPRCMNEKQYLFGHLNSCATSMGERLLVQWIKQPLMDLKKLEERLDIVEALVNDFSLRSELSSVLKKIPDVDSLARRIQRRSASLQDLFHVYLMLMQLPKLKDVLSSYSGKFEDVLKQNFILELEERIEDFRNYSSMIELTIDLDAVQNKEYIVKAEYDDQLFALHEEMEGLLKNIKSNFEKVKKDLDLPSVKLENSKDVGYHFRVTKKDEKNLRHRKGYNVIDAKASGVRFQSSFLKSQSDQYLSLQKLYEKKQQEIVEQIIEVAVSYTHPLKTLSRIISWLDVSHSLATVALNASKQYVRPRLFKKEEGVLQLKQVRHPVLESTLGNFCPNDLNIKKGDRTFYFVTGPNMGGKSTFIRSVALSVLLAQIGSFVPCDSAEISLVDAIFTRIGASDKPSKAVSTLMHEMIEVQCMLKSATSSSLLIIDEMGRGTSTYDGFGLSWAVSKYIAETLCSPCLFATHFHELTALSKQVPVIGNLHVKAITSDDNIVFLYSVQPGTCDESFGIHVAKLAEFPEKVIEDAYQKLQQLNKSHIPLQDIMSEFSQVPGGELILKAFGDISSDMGQNEAENDPKYLEKLSTILTELASD